MIGVQQERGNCFRYRFHVWYNNVYLKFNHEQITTQITTLMLGESTTWAIFLGFIERYLFATVFFYVIKTYFLLAQRRK